MSTSYETCAQSMVYPTALGLSAKTADYSFDKWQVLPMSLDFNEYFSVSTGMLMEQVLNLSSFWPANDIETVLCEGAGCESKSDWSGTFSAQSYLFLLAHDNYDSHKTYVISNATKWIMAF